MDREIMKNQRLRRLICPFMWIQSAMIMTDSIRRHSWN